MFLLRVLVGFLLILLGLAYLFQPKTVLRFNAFMRDTLFKDTHVLLNQKKVGMWLILSGFLLWLISLGMPR